MTNLSPKFHKRSERQLHRGALISLGEGTFVGPEGDEFVRDLVHHPGAVSVVPYEADGTVLLVRQYRAAVERELLEIPAGKRDVADEPPELTAHRELAEEVGRRAGRLELLGTFYNSPGFCDEYSYTYLARELTEVPIEAHSVEEAAMTIERLPLVEALALIATGDIVDAKTIVGLLLAKERVG
ncbi:MAG TPA: NUDIX hydrolase [Acidimicrobiales bacterium]|nr:NUDIX hydrolase [Acidimicrobiales bacterium]